MLLIFSRSYIFYLKMILSVHLCLRLIYLDSVNSIIEKRSSRKRQDDKLYTVSSYREMPDMWLRFSKPNNGSDPVVDRYIHSRLHTYNIHVSFSLSRLVIFSLHARLLFPCRIQNHDVTISPSTELNSVFRQ
jgi:hypothetical protein